MKNPTRLAPLTLILVLAAAGLGGSGLAHAAKKPKKTKVKKVTSVTIRRQVEPVGVTWIEDETLSMDAKISVQQQTIDINTLERKRKTIEVLTSGGDAVTKAKMSYAEYAHQTKTAGKDQTKGAAVVGKSYIVELQNGAVVVTRADGSTPTAEEIALVTDDNKRFGKADGMALALDGMTFKLGEKTPIADDKMAGVFGADDKMKASGVTLTLTEMRGTNAVFAMELTMSGAQGPMNMAITMKATALVDPTKDRLLDLTLEGGLTFSGQVNGTGVMKGHQTTTYQ